MSRPLVLSLIGGAARAAGLLLAAMGLLVSAGVWGASCPKGAAAPVLSLQVLDSFAHRSDAYTQGLLIRDGWFFESVGRWGHSALFRYRPDGRFEWLRRFDRDVFAEGLASDGVSLWQLSWRAGRAWRYRLSDGRLLQSFRYQGEGWGLAFDGRQLWMSDGSAWLQRRSTEDFSLVGGRLRVCDGGLPVGYLNELEFVNGWLLANVWRSDDVVVIDPRSGRVRMRLRLDRLRATEKPRSRAEEGRVANGIAFDAARAQLWLTGKFWDRVYRVALPEVLQ